MHKVLIVDDEPIHRREMANLVRNLRSQYYVVEAENGLDALKAMDGEDFDILITDVKMPLMDGLQLIEAIGEKIGRMKVVVLSGYDYFHYAKKALVLGACDYILKPIDEDAVEEMLTRIEAQIEKRILNEKENKKLQEQINVTFPLYIDYIMNKLMRGKLSEDELEKLEELLPVTEKYRVMVLEVCGSEFTSIDISDIDRQEKVKNYLRCRRHNHC